MAHSPLLSRTWLSSLTRCPSAVIQAMVRVLCPGTVSPLRRVSTVSV